MRNADRQDLTPGYSGTPLVRKLGLKGPITLALIGAPPEYRKWLGKLPPAVRLASPPGRGAVQAAHIFASKRSALDDWLRGLRTQLEPDGFVWVSWPKKASKMPTDITEDVIRDVALPLGFVDVKVCAVSDVWSGLKLVIRKELRSR